MPRRSALPSSSSPLLSYDAKQSVLFASTALPHPDVPHHNISCHARSTLLPLNCSSTSTWQTDLLLYTSTLLSPLSQRLCMITKHASSLPPLSMSRNCVLTSKYYIFFDCLSVYFLSLHWLQLNAILSWCLKLQFYWFHINLLSM